MRTTLTLEEDVSVHLKEAVHDLKKPFKKVVNQALRLGLEQLKNPPKLKKYKLKTVKMGYDPNYNLDKSLQMAANMEDEEIIRKINLRK